MVCSAHALSCLAIIEVVEHGLDCIQTEHLLFSPCPIFDSTCQYISTWEAAWQSTTNVSSLCRCIALVMGHPGKLDAIPAAVFIPVCARHACWSTFIAFAFPRPTRPAPSEGSRTRHFVALVASSAWCGRIDKDCLCSHLLLLLVLTCRHPSV